MKLLILRSQLRQTLSFLPFFLLFWISASFANNPLDPLESSPLTFTTYNVGLAYHFVPLAQERRPHLMKALQQSESDVLCLQEVWLSQDMQDFKQALQKQYPYSYFLPPKQKYTTKAPACYPTDLIGKGKFGSCLLSNCRSKKGDEFTDCIIQTCRQEMDQLKKDNNECAASLFAQVGKSMLQGLVTVLNPFSKVGLWAYEGSAGVMLFSKTPLEKTDVLDFQDLSTSNHRSALYAQVQKNKARYHLVCTHLTADLSKSIPYTGPAQSWEDENFQQVQKILAYLDHKAGHEPQVILGDFNCSLPDHQSSIAGEFEESCQSFIKNGFQNPLLQKNPECTFCTANTLVSPLDSLDPNTATSSPPPAPAGGEKSEDVLIDHIWIKNIPASARLDSEVIFKELIKLDQFPPQNLSDHFGVKTEIHWP